METIESLTAAAEKLKQDIQTALDGCRDKTLIEESADVDALGSTRLRSIRQLKGHINKVYSVAWCKDTGFLLSASQDGRMYVWNNVNGTKTLAVNLESQWVMNCDFSASGMLTASGGLDNLCTIHCVNKGRENVEPVAVLNDHKGFIAGLQFIDDTKIITSGGDGVSLLWDIEKKTIISRFTGHADSIECLALNDDKNTFITGGVDTSVKLFDIRQRADDSKTYSEVLIEGEYVPDHSVRSYKSHDRDINDVAWFPNHSAFGSASEDGRCCLFDLRTDVELNKFEMGGNNKVQLTSCDFSQSGRLVFTGAHSSQIFALDTLKGTLLSQNIHQADNNVTCLHVSPDGYAFATSGWSETVRLWGAC